MARKSQRTPRLTTVTKAPRVDMGELGRTGLTYYGGRVYEEFLTQLSGDKAYKVYTEMCQNDPVIGAFLFAIDMLIRQASWRTEPASDSPEDQEAAQFLDECVSDMESPFTDTVSYVLSFLPYGFALHEIVYKRRSGESRDATKNSKYTDGRIGWRSWPGRAQNTVEWKWDENGKLTGVEQSAPPTYQRVFIPAEKLLLFRSSTRKNNPEGQSVLRNAYTAYYMKKSIQEIEAIGIERDLAGLPVMWVPSNLLGANLTANETAVYNALKDALVNVRRNEQEGLMMPLEYDEQGNKLYEFTLQASGGTRQFDTNEVVNRYDQRIAMTVLADFLLLGSKSTGSYALSSDKTELFGVAIGAWLDAIAGVINTYAVPRLFALNGFKVEQLPVMVHGDIETPDLKDVGEYISKLVGAGMPLFPDDAVENKLREYADLPPKEQGEV